MANPAGTYNDGSLVFGSQKVTFTHTDNTTTGLMIADNIDFEQGAKILTRPDENGVPDAETMINEVGTGSMILQVPATGNAPTAGKFPRRGDTATIKDVDGVATIAIKVSKVGRKFVVDGETKIPVEIREKLN